MSSLLVLCAFLLLVVLADGQWGDGFYFPDEPDDNFNRGYGRWNTPQRPMNRRPSPRPQPKPSKAPSSRQPPVLSAQSMSTQLVSKCGVTDAKRIFGGGPTSPGEFPWQAQLEYREANGQLSIQCGGALIHQRYVLTAAHCIHPNIIKPYTLVKVILGEHEAKLEPSQDFDIERRVMHPQYTGTAQSKNDIALLRLNRDAPYTDYIRPICLPVSGNSGVGLSIVAGWGTTESGQKSKSLLSVAVPAVDINTCATQLLKSIDSTQLCAGGEKGKDSCSGDSGGPLINTETIEDINAFVVIGIVSFGPASCGTLNKPGVYTRVSAFTDWIKGTINA